jgi:NADPH-dependent 2,4-dienoyl-CoA reductase/sulfur reductase-like enzyme
MEAMVRHAVAYGPTFVVMEQEINLHPEVLTDDPTFATLFGAEEHAAWVGYVHQMSGGWTPNVQLFAQSGGKLRFDAAQACFRPAQSVQAGAIPGECRHRQGQGDQLQHGSASWARVRAEK